MGQVKKGFDKYIKNLKKIVGKFKKKTFQKEVMSKLAKETLKIIYKRTKSGKGVSSDTARSTSLVRLKALSPKYVERRKKATRTGPFFSPKKSNLTMTGQLLEAMGFKVNKTGYSVFIKNSRRSEGGITNAEVAGYVREASTVNTRPARPFFALSKDEQLILKRRLERIIRQVAKEFKTSI